MKFSTPYLNAYSDSWDAVIPVDLDASYVEILNGLEFVI